MEETIQRQRMKGTDYFMLTLEERIARIPKKEKVSKGSKYSLEDYYNIEDACSFLEQLRAYQLADILGKYKLF